MPATLFAGKVGTGKTYGLVRAALQSPLPNVWAPRSLQLDMPEKEVTYYDEIGEVTDAKCAYVIVDEADMYFNSRSFASLDERFRRHLKEHRKVHCEYGLATQHPDFIDKTARIFLDNVRLMSKRDWPLVGKIYPTSTVPFRECRTCGIELPDQQPTWPTFGRSFSQDVFTPSILKGEEDLFFAALQAITRQEAVEDAPEVHLGRITYLFDSRIAARYDTHARIAK